MQARTCRFFAEAGKYAFRADTVITVHDSEVMGLLRSYAANDPLTAKQRASIDATASGRFKSLFCWTARAPQAAVFSAQGGGLKSASSVAPAIHAASVARSLSSPNRNLRYLAREELLFQIQGSLHTPGLHTLPRTRFMHRWHIQLPGHFVLIFCHGR
jgi:hypothetical protein